MQPSGASHELELEETASHTYKDNEWIGHKMQSSTYKDAVKNIGRKVTPWIQGRQGVASCVS